MEPVTDIFRFDTGPFNWYVVRDGGRLTVVDAGFPGHYRVFRDGIRALGHEIADVEAILLTHAHADHTGFAGRLSRQRRIPVLIHSADRAAVGRRLQLPWPGLLSNAWRAHVAGMLGHAALHGIFSMPTVPTTTTFEDGESLEVPGRPVALHLPGHTAGEVAFHFPERGALISGDALVTLDLFSGEIVPPRIPRQRLNSNDRQALRSLDRLQGLGGVTLLPGHGPAWHGSMEEAVAGARAAGVR